MKKFLIHHLTPCPIVLALDRREWYFQWNLVKKYYFPRFTAKSMGHGVKWWMRNFFIYVQWTKHLSMTSLSDKYFLRYWPKYQLRRVVTEISDLFSWKIQFSQKWTVLQKKYWKQTPIIFWRSTTFQLKIFV